MLNRTLMMAIYKGWTVNMLMTELAQVETKAQAVFGPEHINLMSVCADLRNIIRTKAV